MHEVVNGVMFLHLEFLLLQVTFFNFNIGNNFQYRTFSWNELFLQCSICTFTQVKELNTFSISHPQNCHDMKQTLRKARSCTYKRSQTMLPFVKGTFLVI